MNRTWNIPLILAIVTGLVAGPSTVVIGGGIDPGVEAGESACDACCGEGAAPGSSSEGADCCPDGCDDCYLACCGGMISLLSSENPAAISPVVSGILYQLHGESSAACARDIEHPPRA